MDLFETKMKAKENIFLVIFYY